MMVKRNIELEMETIKALMGSHNSSNQNLLRNSPFDLPQNDEADSRILQKIEDEEK